MASKTMSGARAKVCVYDATTGQIKVIGTADNLSYGLTYEVQPAYILGRFSAAETAYTSVDVVNFSMSGWRTVGHGWHTEGRLPRVQDLLRAEYIEIHVIDRQTERTITKLTNARITSGSGSYASRALSNMTITGVALLAGDEDVDNDEDASATNLP